MEMDMGVVGTDVKGLGCQFPGKGMSGSAESVIAEGCVKDCFTVGCRVAFRFNGFGQGESGMKGLWSVGIVTAVALAIGLTMVLDSHAFPPQVCAKKGFRDGREDGITGCRRCSFDPKWRIGPNCHYAYKRGYRKGYRKGHRLSMRHRRHFDSYHGYACPPQTRHGRQYESWRPMAWWLLNQIR